MPPSEEGSRCTVHGAEPSVTHCVLCARTMCVACARFLVGGQTACTPCAYIVATRKKRRISFAILAAFMTLTGASFVLSQFHLRSKTTLGVVLAALVCLAAAFYVARGAYADGPDVVPCRPDDLPAHVKAAARARPMSTAARRMMAYAAPPISASHTVMMLVLASGVLLVATPSLLSFPRLFELELALALVFGLLATTFSVLLYRGYRLEDDRVFVAPTPPWQDVGPEAKGRKASSADGCDALGCGDLAGCGDDFFAGGAVFVVMLLALVAFGAVAALAWAVVELVLPLLFFAVYEVLVIALRRVANDRHGCEGDLAASCTWGAAWALLYVVPIGLLVAFVAVVR